MSFFFNDLRHAARAVGRSPGFAVLVIAIMALGIGANTAVFKNEGEIGHQELERAAPTAARTAARARPVARADRNMTVSASKRSVWS